MAELSGRRPPFVVQRDFIENAFERRFQDLLRDARQDRSWHVVTAVPGSGKSYGINDLVLNSGACKQPNEPTTLPVLDVRAPETNPKASALLVKLVARFGNASAVPASERQDWLVKQMNKAGVEQIIADDAHDLSLQHLSLLKELTDDLAAQPYLRTVSLVLVTVNNGDVIPLKEILETPGVHWRQFRRRLDGARPYCLVLGHTEAEVREICAGYEDLYRPQLPDLHLCRWARSLTEWLTHKDLDPEGYRRVTMDYLAQVVTAALRAAYALGRDDIDGDLLRAGAELLTLRRDALTPIDGDPRSDEPGASEVAFG
jgi:hypothetical protein